MFVDESVKRVEEVVLFEGIITKLMEPCVNFFLLANLIPVQWSSFCLGRRGTEGVEVELRSKRTASK